jgi:hypothetical protein
MLDPVPISAAQKDRRKHPALAAQKSLNVNRHWNRDPCCAARTSLIQL